MSGRRSAALAAVSVLIAGAIAVQAGAAVMLRVAPYVDMGAFPTPAL